MKYAVIILGILYCATSAWAHDKNQEDVTINVKCPDGKNQELLVTLYAGTVSSFKVGCEATPNGWVAVNHSE